MTLKNTCALPAKVSNPTSRTACTDTVAVERFTRSGNHIVSDIMQRSPLTYVGHSVIDLAANGLATSWTYDPRLVSGPRPRGVRIAGSWLAVS